MMTTYVALCWPVFTAQTSPELSRHGFHQTPEGVLWYLAP